MRVAININSMMPILLVLFVVFGTVSFSSAEVYKWVDKKGIVHFTDDLMLVPDEFRPQVERREMPEGDVLESEAPDGKTKVDNGPVSGKEEDGYRDRLGRGEEYWKGRINEYQAKLKDYQEKITDLTEKYNDLTAKYNQSKSSAERADLRKGRDQIREELEKLRSQVEETKTLLEQKIPEEAELYKAKPEWLKK